MDNQLYIILKRNNLDNIIKEVFPKQNKSFLEENSDGRAWRQNYRQQNMFKRNELDNDQRRDEWFLKDRHDKMNYMRI